MRMVVLSIRSRFPVTNTWWVLSSHEEYRIIPRDLLAHSLPDHAQAASRDIQIPGILDSHLREVTSLQKTLSPPTPSAPYKTPLLHSYLPHSLASYPHPQSSEISLWQPPFYPTTHPPHSPLRPAIYHKSHLPPQNSPSS